MPRELLVVKVARAIDRVIRPLILDMTEIARLSVVTADKGGGHTAHALDVRAEEVLFSTLESVGYAGRVYSEESGLVRLGNEPRLIVCDPYCNTTLTFRGFRESAIAVYEFTQTGKFAAGAIVDLQVPRVVWADTMQRAFVTTILDEASNVCRRRNDDTMQIRCSEVSHVSDSFLTVALLKRSRREHLPTKLLHDAAMITTVDGAIVAARLALGEIDGYLDIRVGQPSYEALAYALVPKAGGIVTDPKGTPVDFQRIATSLWEGEVSRHSIVAAANHSLHTEILAEISDAT